MAISSTKQVLPQDGAVFDSVTTGDNYFTVIPDGTATGASLALRPGTGTWAALVALTGMANAGYVTALIEGTTTKVRFVVLDHPSGG